jgi:thioredoxin 1
LAVDTGANLLEIAENGVLGTRCKKLFCLEKPMMKKFDTFGTISLIVLGTALLLSPMDVTFAEPAGFPEIPVKGTVTMVDFGAPFCAPCKAMAPFLEKLEKEYKGRAAIVVLDVGKAPDVCERYGIIELPTQIFYNKEGKETLRHTGFMKEEAIVKQLKKMGVK